VSLNFECCLHSHTSIVIAADDCHLIPPTSAQNKAVGQCARQLSIAKEDTLKKKVTMLTQAAKDDDSKASFVGVIKPGEPVTDNPPKVHKSDNTWSKSLDKGSKSDGLGSQSLRVPGVKQPKGSRQAAIGPVWSAQGASLLHHIGQGSG
jgi:hypothetical protein